MSLVRDAQINFTCWTTVFNIEGVHSTCFELLRSSPWNKQQIPSFATRVKNKTNCRNYLLSKSTCLERQSSHIYSIKIIKIFKVLKTLTNIFRAEYHIACLKTVITKKKIGKLQSKSVQSKQLKSTNKSDLSPKRLGVRIRKLLNFILKFYSNFVLEMQEMSAREQKQFLFSFRDFFGTFWLLLLTTLGRSTQSCFATHVHHWS